MKASPKFQRRALLQLAGCAALGLPAVSRAQSDTIKVGLTSLMSGRFALIGSSTVGAVKLLFDRVNAAGGINGRKLQLIVRDSRGLPEEAVKTCAAWSAPKAAPSSCQARRRPALRR